MSDTTAPPSTGAVPAVTARWTSGFWGHVATRTGERTIPHMWEMLTDPTISPGLRNFRIAAGYEDGPHAGPPFMDGDVYKWLEGAISQFETSPQPWLEQAIDEVIDLVCVIQRDDGYVHTPTSIAVRHGEASPELSDRFAFETYNLGHLITAGVRHAQVTGKTRLLDAARKAVDYLAYLAADKPLDLARSAICPSHYMAVMELYHHTDDARYLQLAEELLRVRDDFTEGGDDNQDRIPVRQQRVAAGHAVRANYLYAGLTDLVAANGDDELRQVLEGLWDDVVTTKLYITGGCGALYDGASPNGSPWQERISRVHQAYGRAYQLPHVSAHAESCANIGMILWSRRLLMLTGEAKYADVIEQIALNVLLAGISLDGDAYLYTNPMRQVRDLPYPLRRAGDTALDPVPEPPASDARLREHYLSCFCCPPNTARTLARFHEQAAAASAGVLRIDQYGGSTLAYRGDDAVLTLREDSDYPWDGHIRFTVIAAEGNVHLRLRVPEWARDATLSVCGGRADPVAAGAYASVQREWHTGDVVELVLPMPVRLVRSHRLAEELTNQVAVQRGPLVYCLESADLPDSMPIERIAVQRGASFTPVTTEIAGRQVTALDAELAVLPASEHPDRLYDELEASPLGAVRTRLIPYFAWGNRGPGEMSVWLPVVW